MLAAVLTAAGVELPTDPPDAFADDDGSVHEPAIDALAAVGVVTGRLDRTFGPTADVRRDQLAALVVRAHRLADPPPA
jgi:hypothetical protein